MDLHGIDLNLLVAFDALMAERSVTRAGVRIGRTQPAMSAALSRLRALMKDDLFVRGHDGLHPTPKALDLAEPLAHALADIQRTLDFTQEFDPAASTHLFKLGLSDHLSFVLLPRLLEALGKQAPGVTLDVRSITGPTDAIAMLDAGNADFTIGTTPVQTGRILSAPLFEDRFVCIVRKGHPAAHEPLSLETYLSLSHLLVSLENQRFGVVDAALAKRGLKRRLALTVPYLHAVAPIVASSDLISTMLTGVVSGCGFDNRLCILEPPIVLDPLHFSLYWHRRNDAHPAQRWLRMLIASLFEPPAAAQRSRKPVSRKNGRGVSVGRTAL